MRFLPIQRSDPTDLEQTGDVRTVYEIQRGWCTEYRAEKSDLPTQQTLQEPTPKSLHSLFSKGSRYAGAVQGGYRTG